MTREFSNCLTLTMMFLASTALAAERQNGTPLAGADLPKPIGMFQAIDGGQVDVRFIPLDATRANVLVENRTDRVLHIALPSALAAVPVLGQLGAGIGQAGGGGGGGASQSVGGGFNGGGGNQGVGNQQGGGRQGFGNQQGGFGMMRIAPHKTRKLQATTVCLEHGKLEPQPRIAYRMVPIDRFTQDERVVSLCKRLGQGKIPQNTAQAAAWHLANGLSWDRLAKINRIESRYVGNVKRFKASEIEGAKEAVEAIGTAGGDSYDEK